jgi:hypothetical protein
MFLADAFLGIIDCEPPRRRAFCKSSDVALDPWRNTQQGKMDQDG